MAFHNIFQKKEKLLYLNLCHLFLKGKGYDWMLLVILKVKSRFCVKGAFPWKPWCSKYAVEEKEEFRDAQTPVWMVHLLLIGDEQEISYPMIGASIH